jgi:DNA-directed RNA polymerase subunit L
MLKQHLLLKFYPERSFASFSVRHPAEELPNFTVECPEDVFAIGQRNTAGEVQQIARVRHLFA